MPQALSNPGVDRLWPRSMLLGGNGLHKQMWELGLKENECVSSRRRLGGAAVLWLPEMGKAVALEVVLALLNGLRLEDLGGGLPLHSQEAQQPEGLQA